MDFGLDTTLASFSQSENLFSAAAAGVHVKVYRDCKSLKSNFAASWRHEILRSDVRPFWIEALRLLIIRKSTKYCSLFQNIGYRGINYFKVMNLLTRLETLCTLPGPML